MDIKKNDAYEPEEVHHDSLIQTIESRISHASTIALKSTGNRFVLVLVIKVETEDISGEGVIHSVETLVARVDISFDQICKDA